ncbi:MAG: hypothetical protein AAGE84_30970 [Cyanobacteria bacterium P01_G01_bin.39]
MATILADNFLELLSVLVLAFAHLRRIKLTYFSVTKLFPFLSLSLSPYLPIPLSPSTPSNDVPEDKWGVQRGFPFGKPFEHRENMACSKPTTILV